MAVLFGPQNITHTWGVRTLARIPMAGGSRRDVLSGVVDADWIPGTDALAVVRDSGGNRPWTVEFPAGTTVYETRAAWSLRVSPDGSRVAFFEGPVMFGSAPRAMITVVDRSGRKSTVARDWAGFGLAWAPSGREIWFTATRAAASEFAPSLHAVSLSGVERPVYRAPDWLVLHDIFPDGRVLLSRNTIHINLTCKRPGDTSERDLTWQLASAAKGISPDGKTLVFEDELLSAPSGNPVIFSRSIEGSPAISIGEGSGAAWLPTGSGCSRYVERTSPDTDGGRCDGHAAEGRPYADWTWSVAARLEAYCFHWLRRGQHVARLPSENSSRPSSRDNPAGSRSRRQVGCARRQLRPRPRWRHVGALSDSRRGWPARFSAHAWRYPASMEPWRPIRVHRRQRRWGQAGSRRCLPPGVGDWGTDSLENAPAVRPRGRGGLERNRGDDP